MKKLLFILGSIIIMQACSYEDKPLLEELKNGWTFQNASGDEIMPATVPGSVHIDLLNNGKIEDPFYRMNESDQQWIDKLEWTYYNTFEVDESLLEKQNIELIFEGLDTYAEVSLNDSLFLICDNMFVEWRANCKDLLKLTGNKLKIKFKSPINEGLKKLAELGYPLPASNDQSEIGELGNNQVSIFTRKAPYHYGWDWGPRFVTSGVWKPVRLKGWNTSVIEDVHFNTKKISKDIAEIDVTINLKSFAKTTIDVKLSSSVYEMMLEKTYRLKPGSNSFKETILLENPSIWWPNGIGDQPLYDLTTTIYNEDIELDSKETKFGIRTIEVVQEKDSIGRSFYFKVNGEPVFMKGANYIPSDVFLSRVKEDDYRAVIKSAVDANMNMLRVWGGGIYEKDIFYDLCDEYGILIWQDFMFACSMYPNDDEFLQNVEREAIQNVIRLRNHPSIAIWCGNNEILDAWNRWGWQTEFESHKDEIWKGYEDIFYDLLPRVVSKYDSSRFYLPSSPSWDYKNPSEYHSGDMHYWGVWHGLEPFENFDTKVGRFMSEYGFQSFPEFSTVQKYTTEKDWDIESDVMKSHQRSGIGNLRIRDYTEMYFNEPKNFEMQLYVGQLLQAYGIEKAIHAHRRNKPLCMGTLYWQLNDCWPVASWSSTDYYRNWKALHYSVKKSFENILISPYQIKDSVQIYIVSDLIKPAKGELSIQILKFDGSEILNNKSEIFIEANTSERITTIEIPDELTENEIAGSMFKIALQIDGGTVASINHYFVIPKELNLEKPNISIVLNGKNELTITTDKFAKNVFLNATGYKKIHFSDNYFDLLPDEEKIISYCGTLSGKEPVIISAISLYDSYNKNDYAGYH